MRGGRILFLGSACGRIRCGVYKHRRKGTRSLWDGGVLVGGCQLEVFLLPIATDNFGAIMGFGDLKSPSGLQLLNSFLADKSYIEG